MKIRSLNQLRWLRVSLISILKSYHRIFNGLIIDQSSSISLATKFRQKRRGLIRVNEKTLLAFDVLILTYDFRSSKEKPVNIGPNCFIGGGSIIMPGVSIGEGSIVAAGALVVDDVPAFSMVGGNPARILRSDIETGAYGRLATADANSRRLYKKVIQG